MKIILHTTNYMSLFSIVCSLVTMSNFSHASIVDEKGARWDAKLERGFLGESAPVFHEPEREIAVIDIGDVEIRSFLLENMGKKYNLKGILLWPFGIKAKDRWHCFEAANACLNQAGIGKDIGTRISGRKLLSRLMEKGYKAVLTKGKNYEQFI